MNFFNAFTIIRLLVAILLMISIAGCEYTQHRYSPTAIEQSFTNKNTAIHFNPAILKVGTPRSQVVYAFGEPNANRYQNGEFEDIFLFYPDGSKYVNPSPRARNVAMAYFTMGTSVAVRQARLEMQRRKLTAYHVFYAPNETIDHVNVIGSKSKHSHPPVTNQAPTKTTLSTVENKDDDLPPNPVPSPQDVKYIIGSPAPPILNNGSE